MSNWSFIQKPSGVSTHQVEERSTGFAEYLNRATGRKHWVVHRLDKGTSGAMIFAHDSESASRLAGAFEQRHVEKTYFFVTNRSLKQNSAQAEITRREQDSFFVSSFIEKQGSRFVSSAGKTPNAQTSIRLIKTEGAYSLWEAVPVTGRSHQIRLHAEALGLSILGDEAHGGTPFPRLMLHAGKLGFQDLEIGTFETPLPRLFRQMELLSDPDLARWIVGIERREVLFGLETTQCRRLLHTDGGFLRLDLLGPIAFFYWFGPTSPGREVLVKIGKLSELFALPHWFLRWMQNRGSGVQDLPLWQSDPPPPIIWTAQERGMIFEMRAQSLSPGLFLDQRSNRQWVQENASGKKVLNLFCYTGGFSVAAGLGGASEIISVDLSSNFLRWLDRNFDLNGLSQGETWAWDSRKFLDTAFKKKRKFDLIICDPPSFSRSSEGLFRIEKELGSLVEKISQVLAPGGTLLFCTNYEKWDSEQFETLCRPIAKQLRLRLAATPPADWDFELPQQTPVMKSILFHASRTR